MSNERPPPTYDSRLRLRLETMNTSLNSQSKFARRVAVFLAGAIVLGDAIQLNASEPWPGVPFETVRAFAWSAEQDQSILVQPDLTLRPGAVDPTGRLLSVSQVNKLIAAVTRKRAPGRLSLSSCFEPHHAFIFYDASGRPVAFVEVCLRYHGYRLAPDLPELEPHYGDLAALCVELELPLPKDFSLGEYRRQFEDTYINGEGFEGAD